MPEDRMAPQGPAPPEVRPGPPERRPRLGPRPLPQHLILAAAPLLMSRAGSLPWKSGSPGSRPPSAVALRAELDAADPEALQAAIEAEASRRLAAFLTGVERYRRHPYRRTVADPPVLWRAGTTRLLDYGAPAAGGGTRPRRGRRRPPAILVVPSLVNRAHILDLDAECSLLRYLAGRGLRPLLVDWDRPGPAERAFTLTDYVVGRLEAALDAAIGEAGGPVTVVGYCMGGLLALALALRRRDDVSGLVCLATPWDFQAERPAQARLAAAAALWLEPQLAALQELPVDVIQMLLTVIDPYGVVRKFRDFAALDPESPRAARFAALEDWLNDGVPLAAPVARECLAGWYGANTPARGAWRIDGQPVRPEGLDRPALIVLPDRDRIVPPGSAAALAGALPRVRTLRPSAGHIGMIVGRDAEATVWRPLADWLLRPTAP